jgi:arabinofuranosyltransferase
VDEKTANASNHSRIGFGRIGLPRFGLLALLCIPLLFVGWRAFYFLTDDAYISFRYVSNSIFGYGYVWNPPPFQPVEGYSNFLWVVVIDAVWRLLGIEPPQSSNYLSLVFSFGTLLVVIAMGLKMRLSETLSRYRVVLVGLVLWATLTNRTFLAWTSSGLETAMFNFFVTLWLYACIFAEPQRRSWLFVLTLGASCAALTRPDGLLFWASTIVVLVFMFVRDRKPAGRWLSALPAALVPLHFVWRRAFYHEWLPNTYYAKTTAPWPESGARYFASFVLEYGVWIWLGLALFVLARAVLRSSDENRRKRQPGLRRLKAWGRRLASSPGDLAAALAVLSLAGHLAFYTLIIGGDHFEYRVYSHTVPLIFLSFVWLLNRSGARAVQAVALFAVFIALSYPLPWTHWKITRHLTTREETFRLEEPVAPHFPSFLAWYAKPFDRVQEWLIDRSVCMRHQEHKVFCELQRSMFPTREKGMELYSDTYPVCALALVGVPSWVMPKINIIDTLGLNDYVIARTPVDLYRNMDPYTNPRGLRQMAHDRRAPEGYVEGFEPNVAFSRADGTPAILPREAPMTAERIVQHEKKWREFARSSRKKG